MIYEYDKDRQLKHKLDLQNVQKKRDDYQPNVLCRYKMQVCDEWIALDDVRVINQRNNVITSKSRNAIM